MDFSAHLRQAFLNGLSGALTMSQLDPFCRSLSNATNARCQARLTDGQAA